MAMLEDAGYAPIRSLEGSGTLRLFAARRAA